MSHEPDFISQCGEPLTESARLEWFMSRAREAEDAGAVLARYSVHPDIPDLILFEAWKVRPADQGEIRWQLVVTDAENPSKSSEI
jgi:hypothetical protein